MDGTRLFNNFVNGGRYALFFGNICLNTEQTTGELLGGSLELLARFRKVNRVDSVSTVEKTTLGNSQTNAAICPVLPFSVRMG
ncbi:uncharacterized protein CTRU02_209348 [Colletotrichum truncatum]|uniref:Uncharacterized protein n=1 Tax=Colletotrichum truncatum TaxID=5467 RepID=A0ACC3YUD3_COLTU|nr:uncharacterized protein CTRU02_08579 [Colletotrichum truncatum]KAF6789880.1 hypothetical protein CTRU02_08579 [Colletotrichum truncatum]